MNATKTTPTAANNQNFQVRIFGTPTETNGLFQSQSKVLPDSFQAHSDAVTAGAANVRSTDGAIGFEVFAATCKPVAGHGAR